MEEGLSDCRTENENEEVELLLHHMHSVGKLYMFLQGTGKVRILPPG